MTLIYGKYTIFGTVDEIREFITKEAGTTVSVPSNFSNECIILDPDKNVYISNTKKWEPQTYNCPQCKFLIPADDLGITGRCSKGKLPFEMIGCKDFVEIKNDK